MTIDLWARSTLFPPLLIHCKELPRRLSEMDLVGVVPWKFTCAWCTCSGQCCVCNFHIIMRCCCTYSKWNFMLMLCINMKCNRLCLIIAGIPWSEVQSLPGSRSKSGAAFQMQNIVHRNRHDLLKIPRPVCYSSTGDGQSLWKAHPFVTGTFRYHWVYWGVRSSLADSLHHTLGLCRACSCSRFFSKLENWLRAKWA